MRTDMAKTRALITQTERDRIARREDVEDIKRYQAISRVRRRIEDELTEDVAILREHHPGLLEEIRDVVCEDTATDGIKESDSSESWSDTEIDESVAEVKQEMDKDFEESAGAVGSVGEEDDHSSPEDVVPDLPAETEISDDVWSVVNEVSASWDDDPERLETRRKAAATVLQYALTHDVYLGKSSDAVEAIREKYPVEGQNAETWWRKNVRGVLKVVGTYSRGQHGYAVEDLEVDDE